MLVAGWLCVYRKINTQHFCLRNQNVLKFCFELTKLNQFGATAGKRCGFSSDEPLPPKKKLRLSAPTPKQQNKSKKKKDTSALT